MLYQTSVGAEDLLELLLQEFEVRGRFTSRASRLAAFNQFLLTAYSRREHVVLMVDEAQNLGPEALEELRLLSNLQAGKDPLLQVILVGQSGLREKLKHPALETVGATDSRALPFAPSGSAGNQGIYSFPDPSRRWQRYLYGGGAGSHL